MSCLECEGAIACECCERCAPHCIGAAGCVYKPFGEPDPIPMSRCERASQMVNDGWISRHDAERLLGVVKGLDLFDLQFWVEEKTEPKAKPACPDCHRELSSMLDAYYGKDDYWGRFCTPCRTKRLGK